MCYQNLDVVAYVAALDDVSTSLKSVCCNTTGEGASISALLSE